jgi:hypothetical protein
MAENWMHIATVDYGVKLVIGLLIFVPAYGMAMKAMVNWFMN